MSVQTSLYQGELLELTLRGRELAQAGDWLTRCGLPGQSLNIELLPGKITIQAEQRLMME